MTPKNWFRTRAGRGPAQQGTDPRTPGSQNVPNFWGFLIHVTGDPASWSGIAKLAALGATVVLSLTVSLGLLIGATGWALHEVPIPGRAGYLTTAGAVAGILGSALAALRTLLVRRKLVRPRTPRGDRGADADQPPWLRLVGDGAA